MLAFLLFSLANNKPFSCFSKSHQQQSIRLIHLLVCIPLFVWSANFSTLKYSLECHRHIRGAMITRFIPGHVQDLNYNQWNLLPLQRHGKGNGSKSYFQLQFLLLFLIIILLPVLFSNLTNSQILIDRQKLILTFHHSNSPLFP